MAPRAGRRYREGGQDDTTGTGVIGMLVRDRMTSPVITTRPGADTSAALKTMYVHKVRRLPVVDERDALVGIVTQRTLYEHGKATTPVGDLMTPGPYTTAPEVPIVEAAAKMRTLGFGALPVVDHGRLVGIITESDIFDAFLDLLGAGRIGTHLVVPITSVATGVRAVLDVLAHAKAPLTGVATYVDRHGPSVVLTADEQDPRDLVRALRDAGFEPSQISVQKTAGV
jgi:acetoin utilization protein AcuB